MKKTIFLNRLVLFLIIFNSGGIPIVSNFFISLLIILLILVNIQIQIKYNLKYTLGLIPIFILLFFNELFANNANFSPTYIIFFSYFVVAFFFIVFYKNRNLNFVDDLFFVLKIYMIHAIFSFVIAILFEGQLSVTHIFGWNNIKTFYMLAYYSVNETAFIFIRNQGLFWEPGVLQMYMNILFYLSVFIKKNKTIALFSSIVILSTFSTTGILILFLQLAIFVFMNEMNFKKKLLFIPIGFLLLIVLSPILSDNIENKFEGTNKRSSYGRIFDFYTAINIIHNYPLLGIGLDDNKYDLLKHSYGYIETELTETEIENRGNTNGIFKIIYQFGIPIAIVFFFLIYKQQLILRNQFLFYMIIFVSLLSEPLFMSPFVILFIASGINNVLFKQRALIGVENEL